MLPLAMIYFFDTLEMLGDIWWVHLSILFTMMCGIMVNGAEVEQWSWLNIKLFWECLYYRFVYWKYKKHREIITNF